MGSSLDASASQTSGAPVPGDSETPGDPSSFLFAFFLARAKARCFFLDGIAVLIGNRVLTGLVTFTTVRTLLATRNLRKYHEIIKKCQMFLYTSVELHELKPYKHSHVEQFVFLVEKNTSQKNDKLFDISDNEIVFFSDLHEFWESTS